MRNVSAADLLPKVIEGMLSTPVLGSTSRSAVSSLARQGSVRHNRKSTYLFYQEDPSDHVFFLIEGRVEISSLSPSGHRQWHAILEPPQFFGEIGVLGDLPRNTSALSIEETWVWTVAGESFVAFISQQPSASRGLIRALARQVHAHGTLVDDLLFLDLKGRVAKRLLGLASISLDVLPPNGNILPMVTHADLASLAGGSRENVSRILSDFQKRGLISKEGRRYALSDVNALAKLAGLKSRS